MTMKKYTTDIEFTTRYRLTVSGDSKEQIEDGVQVGVMAQKLDVEKLGDPILVEMEVNPFIEAELEKGQPYWDSVTGEWAREGL